MNITRGLRSHGQSRPWVNVELAARNIALRCFEAGTAGKATGLHVIATCFNSRTNMAGKSDQPSLDHGLRLNSGVNSANQPLLSVVSCYSVLL